MDIVQNGRGQKTTKMSKIQIRTFENPWGRVTIFQTYLKGQAKVEIIILNPVIFNQAPDHLEKNNGLSLKLLYMPH